MWIIASILASIIGAVVAGVGSKRQENAQKQANETNLQITRETNQANAEQAELAYKRSLPINQVSNMMAAGMSKSAALQSLSGGGSYSAPVMQSAQMNPAYGDLSALAERIGGIPSNAQQSAMIKQQLESMKLDNDIKREQLELAKAQAAREATIQTGDFEAREYDRQTSRQTDALRAIINKRAAEFKVNLNDIKSEQDLIDKLKLNDVAEWRDARSSSRDNVLSYLGVTNNMRNANRAADDVHDLQEGAKIIQAINISYLPQEKKTQLLGLMRQVEGYLQDNNLKFQQVREKDLQNILREAGIDTQAEAKEIEALVRKLAADDELSIQVNRKIANEQTFGVWNNFRMFLRDLGELFSSIKL